MFVFNNRNKRWIGSMGAVLMGAAVVCVPMDVQASGALGSSSQVGISADLEAVEDTSVLEVAMNDIVISEFNLEGYSNLGIVTVSEGKVNIRETPSTDGKIVGKIGKDAGCDVLGEEGEWLRIRSGEVEGYIKAEYVLTGTDALQQASTLLKKVAKVTTDGLKVRTEPNTECEILDMVGSGQSFDVLEELDGWVRIDLDGETGYLSTDYVEVGSQLDEALTISELLYGEGVSNVRVAISDYAKQFIGNPYVWGGTSLTNGVDCSGFTQQVFANYGISLPHSSKAQAGYGTAVDVQEAQPGDLIFYADNGSIYHVVIYIGNGQAVHASSAKTGIKISDVQYDKASCAVSLL